MIGGNTFGGKEHFWLLFKLEFQGEKNKILTYRLDSN